MHKYLTVFLVAMVPVAELRLAVPMAIGMGIDKFLAIAICVAGNIVPVPFIYLFARRFLHWGAKQRYIGKLCTMILEKGERAGQKIVKKTGRYGLFVALLLFVGIPVPGTGAWTGTLAASFLDMGFKSAFASVALGVVLAGCIMALASAGVFHIIGL